MSHTNETTYLKLPQWIATDKPTWLGDMNQAMGDLDTGMAAFNTKVNSFDATVAAATQAANDATAAAAAASQAASSAQAAAAAAAPLDSPAFVGAPTAPTPTKGDATNRVATAAFVNAALSDYQKKSDTAWVPIYSTDNISFWARIFNGVVYLDCNVTGGFQLQSGVWKDFTTLPADYRTDTTNHGSGFAIASASDIAVKVFTSGVVTVLSSTEDLSYWGFSMCYPL